MPHALNDFTPIGAGETVSRSIAFDNVLTNGETVIGAPVCTITVFSGATDGSPQSRLIGGPSINPAGTQVAILFGGGGQIVGAIYQILVTALTSMGQTVECYAFQLVQAQ